MAECPLCGRSFSHTDIEVHASTCNGIKKRLNEQETKSPMASIFSAPNGIKKRPLEQESKPPVASIFSASKKIKTLSAENDKIDIDKRPEVDKSANSTHGNEFQFDLSKPIKNTNPPNNKPLAEKMRPTDFNSYEGQEEMLGKGTQLRRILDDLEKGGRLPSLILWGPPGCGKTSLANVIASKTKERYRFVKMSACVAGVAEVKEMVKVAKNELSMFKRQTILFMDEVHRFNKSQQDSFLPHVEAGVVTFIGATTENPSFSLNAALLSRCRVVALGKLSYSAMLNILRRAVNAVPDIPVSVSDEALEFLAKASDGDARAGLNNLQLVMDSAGNEEVGLQQVKEAVRRSHVLYDRSGDQHYHFASALQKSIRGGNDSAALYYLARMLKGGEDPVYIGRRLVRTAAEDIGLGDPGALQQAVSALQGTQLLGRPECDVLLAQAAVYLARAKKNAEVYRALNRVYQEIETSDSLPPVPLHLRNPTSKMTRDLGWGKGYSYDPTKVGGFEYMPQGMEGRNLFKE